MSDLLVATFCLQHLYKRFKEYTGRLNSASTELIKNIEHGKEFPVAGALNDEAHALVKVVLVDIISKLGA